MSGRISLGKIGARRTARVLPYDAEVEYLESTGTQWIDTGLVDSTLTYDATVIFPSSVVSNTSCIAYGTRSASTGNAKSAMFIQLNISPKSVDVRRAGDGDSLSYRRYTNYSTSDKLRGISAPNQLTLYKNDTVVVDRAPWTNTDVQDN